MYLGTQIQVPTPIKAKPLFTRNHASGDGLLEVGALFLYSCQLFYSYHCNV